MDTEKSNEFKKYLQEVISGNAPDVLGKRAVLNATQSKKITTISGILKIPSDEEIIIFFDDTITGSGKKGLLLTSWGIRYEWDMSWEEMAEKFNFFTIEGLKLKIQNGQGNNITAEKEIDLTMAYFDVKWLKRILITGCRIFTGKEIGKEETVVSPVQNNSVPQKPEAAISETETEVKKPIQNIETPKMAPKTPVRTSGEGIVVYKDWKMIISTWVVTVFLPIFGIKAFFDERHSPLMFIGGSILISILSFIYNKYLRGGIILDIKSRFISFPKFELLSFFRPFPRTNISFDDITGIQSTDHTEVERNAYGGYKTTMSGSLSLLKTYKFSIVGTFGSKTITFRNREKRDQFYSLLASYGNFS